MRYITKELKRRGFRDLTKVYKNNYKTHNLGFRISKHFSKITSTKSHPSSNRYQNYLLKWSNLNRRFWHSIISPYPPVILAQNTLKRWSHWNSGSKICKRQLLRINLWPPLLSAYRQTWSILAPNVKLSKPNWRNSQENLILQLIRKWVSFRS